MNKQLTEAQMESLHMFCAKHYVPYYDVQIELVDHMASAIENRWITEPNVSFEQALDDVYVRLVWAVSTRCVLKKKKSLEKSIWGCN